MSGAFCQVKAGSVGSAAENASYITRSSASSGAVYHNAPDGVREAETWRETRVQLRSWADRVETEEVARHGNRAGQPRTHYRAILSYEEKVETEAALEDAEEWLEEAFEDTQAVAVVHQDTDHTHVHVWMSPRKLDGKKIHIANGDLKEINGAWDRVYEERMQRPGRIVEKMEETEKFKRRYAELEAQGASKEELAAFVGDNRPDRANPPGPDVYRERDERRLSQDTLQEVRQEREPRERRVKSNVERSRKEAERQKERVQWKRERLKREMDKLGIDDETGDKTGDRKDIKSDEQVNKKIDKSNERDEGRSETEKSSARGGAGEAKPAERGAEGADHPVGDRRGQGGDQRRAGGSDIGDEQSSTDGEEGRGEGVGDKGGGEANKRGSGAGEEELGREGGESGGDHTIGNRTGGDELVGDISDSLDGGSGGGSGGQGTGRPDDVDSDAGAGMGHSSGGVASASGGFLEGGEVEVEQQAKRIRDASINDEAEAAKIYQELPQERREEVWEELMPETRRGVRRGRAEIERREAGTQAVYEALGLEEQGVVDALQIEQEKTGRIRSDTFNKKLKGLLGDNEGPVEKAQEIGEALPQEGATKVLKKFAEKVGADRDQSQDRSKGQSQDRGKGQSQDRSRGRGGWGRGR